MRRRLQPQGAVDQRLHRRQSALAEGGLQVDMILMAQAHEDLALAGHAHAVAIGAEIMGERRDQPQPRLQPIDRMRSEEHTSELQSLMRISYAVFCLKKKKK